MINILTVAFIVLQVVGVTNYSWWWLVLYPLLKATSLFVRVLLEDL